MTAKRETESPDVMASFRPETATPEDVETLIDIRIDKIDAEISGHLSAVEGLRTERKKWLGVTGGRSRANPEEEPAP